MANPAPTDLKIAQATLPVGVNKISQPKRNDSNSGADKIERGSRQDQTETGEGFGIADFARFQPKTSRFIIEEVLFQVKTQPMFVKGAQIGRIITENSPFFKALLRLNMRQHRVNRTKSPISNPNLVQKQRVAFGRNQATDTQAGFTDPVDPQRFHQPNVKAPAQVSGSQNRDRSTRSLDSLWEEWQPHLSRSAYNSQRPPSCFAAAEQSNSAAMLDRDRSGQCAQSQTHPTGCYPAQGKSSDFPIPQKRS